ncbi:MAG: EamA family transporter [Eubacteriales bacterium]
MSNLLVLVLVLLFSFQSGFCNMFSRNYPGDRRYSSQIYSIFYGVIVSLVTLVFAGFSIRPSLTTVLLGLFNGAVLVLYNAMLIKASAAGPFSIVMIFNLSGGILIPMVWSILVDKMQLSPLQYAAIAVMLVSFVFLNLEDKGEKSPVSAKFLLYALILGMANGTYGTLLNLQKNLLHESENAEMIVVTFLSSAVFAFVLLLLQAGRAAFPCFRQNVKSALYLTAASVSAAAAVNILMYALSIVNVAVLYAMDNGGVLLVSVLWSVVILKEKIGKKKILGLVLAILAIFALGLLQSAG